MNRRHATTGLVFAAFLTIAVEPVAAQSINKALIESLNRQLLYVAVPLAILVEVILFYAVWKHKDNEDPSPTKENRSLEITWTIATAIILLFVGFASYNILTDPYISPSLTDQAQPGAENQGLEGAVMPADPDDAIVVRTIAYQWGWDFVYPEENVATDNVTVVPANTDIYYHLTSRDVIHAFHAPELGLKMDTIPGQYNTIRTNISEPGTYRVYCSEFCGAGHSRMYANLTVVSQDRYEAWLANQNHTSVSTRVSAENATNVSASVAAPSARATA